LTRDPRLNGRGYEKEISGCGLGRGGCALTLP
jgi:hypothetical protein